MHALDDAKRLSVKHEFVVQGYVSAGAGQPGVAMAPFARGRRPLRERFNACNFASLTVGRITQGLAGPHSGSPVDDVVRLRTSENRMFPMSIDEAFVPSQRDGASASDVAEPLPMSTAFVVTMTRPSGSM